MEPHCLGKATDPGRSGRDSRRFVETALWIVRTGSPWRDLPASFGKWNTVFKRYRDWRHLVENFFGKSRSSSASPGVPARPTEASAPQSTSPLAQ